MAIHPISLAGSEYTVADLELIDDERNRYELCDGALVVTPAPGDLHQRILRKLVVALDGRFEPEDELLPGVGIHFTDTWYRIPDLVVMPTALVGADRTAVPPSLVIEIVSPSTNTIDREHKRVEYARFGVPEYWLVDPEARTITALVLRDGAYVEAESALATDAASAVFAD
ncbi:MAG TPA: Uma2 family endonuclease [Acidimicrobiales bacterium]|nr:Uma2 family endonuclease [Acidimicrobiales bacterium]